MHRLMQSQGDGLLLAPRGFGKSTVGTVCCALWAICVNPNLRILISSATAGKAEMFMREIKTHLEQNEMILKLFGVQKDDVRGWNQSEIYVKPRTLIAKEPSLVARGWSGAVVGLHFDIHFVDDLVTEDNARTKGQREKLKDWFYMSLDPTLEPHGWRCVIGTRYHYDDLYGHLIEMAKAEREEAKGLTDEEVRLSVKPLQILRLQAITPAGVSLWEDKWPIKKLQARQRRMGKVRFASQYQNETDLMKGTVFKEEYFEHYVRDQLDLAPLHIFQGCDLAIGKKDSNDFFTHVTKAYDPLTNQAYTLDVVQGRYTYREQMMIILWKAGKTREEIASLLNIPTLSVKQILDLFRDQSIFSRRQWAQVRRIGVEAVAYQRVLPDELLTMTSDLPIIKIEQKLDKLARMQRYAARWENHMEYLPLDNSCDNLKEELLLFDGEEGADKHDDICDAHEICNRVASMLFDDDADNDEDSEVTARVF